MKQVRNKQNQAKTLSLSAKRRINEGLLILFSAVSLFILIALITYHSSDPAWSRTGTTNFFANAEGKVGAWISDMFLYMFGYVAYLFPIMLAAWAWLAFFDMRKAEKAETALHKLHLSLRVLGFILILLAGTGLTVIYLGGAHNNLPFSSGGILGVVVSKFLIPALNLAGTQLLLIAFFLIGVTLFTGLSWLKVIDSLGKVLLAISSRLCDCFYKVRDIIRNRKLYTENIDPKIFDSVTIMRPEEQIDMRSAKVVSVSKPYVYRKPLKKNKLYGTSLPSLDILNEPPTNIGNVFSNEKLHELSKEVEQRLLDFGISVRVVAVHPGPVITRFELDLAAGIKVSKMTALVKDLARALSVSRVRIVEVIPGKSVVGLEIPNENRNLVCLRELYESSSYQDAASPLSLAIGKDIAGFPFVVDLAKMPHLLVAGTTGSGKSVSLNTMLLSMLFKATPDVLRLILIDPKMLELSVYDGIPHLLAPVVTDMKEAANAFRWCISEMDRRYRLMASIGVRNLAGFNAKINKAIKSCSPILDPFVPKEVQSSGQPITLEPLPNIVIVVDELADMMMLVGKKVEELITRIAQKARAAGIHMILATQRPSVDVITGLIKSNIPTRIAFQVSSRIDSRTILDQQGAEQLIGCGDMLYLPPGSGHPIRVHGAYVSDDEMRRVVDDWKKRGEPDYMEEILEDSDDGGNGASGYGGNDFDAEQDPLYDQAVNIVIESKRASISYVQRRLRIGYNRAATILEAMEKAGLVSEMSGSGVREVLIGRNDK